MSADKIRPKLIAPIAAYGIQQDLVAGLVSTHWSYEGQPPSLGKLTICLIVFVAGSATFMVLPRSAPGTRRASIPV